MTENSDVILTHSNGCKDSKSLVLPTKDLLDSNGCDGTKDSLACEKERIELWNVQELDDSVFFEDISRSNKHEIRASPLKDDLNEVLSNLTSCKRNGNPFACDTADRDHPWSIPKFEDPMIVNFFDDKEKEAVVSNAQFTSISELFGTDTQLYTDKGILEFKLPESTICYDKSNYHTMKDICMDEGVPLMDKTVTESRKDDQHDSSISLAADEHQPRNTREGIDCELVSSGESKASSVDSAVKISVDHHTTKEDEDTKSLVPTGINPFLEDNMSKDAHKDSYLDVMKIFGSKDTTTAKTTNISEKVSDVQNSKESNYDADQSAQQPNQMPTFVAAFNSPNTVSAADGTNNNGPGSNLSNNSKSKSGAITCDFNLTELSLSSSVVKSDKNLPEQSPHKLEAVSGQKDGSSDSFSATTQVHFANSVDSNNSSIHAKSLDPPNVVNLEEKNSSNLPLGVHGHFADGEASFSALEPTSGLISYSGHISQSGNISLRSDSSTTSARSFAFPVLQSEWNSSPVRMAKAERRHYKGWRQSLLCCKF